MLVLGDEVTIRRVQMDLETEAPLDDLETIDGDDSDLGDGARGLDYTQQIGATTC